MQSKSSKIFLWNTNVSAVAPSSQKSKGVVPNYLVIFSDNCSRQYKGKGTFQFHSESESPLLHMFFGARHGKGPADGAVGRIKNAAMRAIKSRP